MERSKTSEQQDFYKVVFLPNDPQTLGGGLRVWVDKYELQVKQVVHLQQGDKRELI
jgi:hypothetical protein